MSDREITPALTEEEWVHPVGLELGPDCWYEDELEDGLLLSTEAGTSRFDVSRRHALAALCLYQQPFGFTHEHLIALRTLLDEADQWIGERYSGTSLANLRVLQEKADEALENIAALLPPAR